VCGSFDCYSKNDPGYANLKGTIMINLNSRRATPLAAAAATQAELPQLDLSTVQFGDWIEGIGIITDYAVVGLCHQLGRLGYGIAVIPKGTS
jgi:hypothetical protein